MQIPLACQSGVVDSQLQCCASGLVTPSGACCPAGAVLDAAGACCTAGVLDSCGVCGGAGKYVDLSGACCPTQLDANGMCCQVGAGWRGGRGGRVAHRGGPWHELPCTGFGVCQCIDSRACLPACLPTPLPPSLQSGAVDECGVCNGLGNSCAVEVALAITVSPQLIHADSIEVGAVGGCRGWATGRIGWAKGKGGRFQQRGRPVDQAPPAAVCCVV